MKLSKCCKAPMKLQCLNCGSDGKLLKEKIIEIIRKGHFTDAETADDILLLFKEAMEEIDKELEMKPSWRRRIKEKIKQL